MRKDLVYIWQMLKLSFYVLFVLLLISCTSPGNKEISNTPKAETKPAVKEILSTGRIIPKVTTINDATLSYALYLPISYSMTKKWPVLILFDAQARGSLPLELYKSVAEQMGYILMCSNDSKNGNAPELTTKIIGTMLQEAITKYYIDTNRIYTGGFSGGARIASMCAINNPVVKGVIGVSAGFPANGIPDHQFRFIGITGKQDFNYNELTQLDITLSQSHFPHALLVHNGIHDWCPAELMNNALTLFDADAMRKKYIPVNGDLLKQNKTVCLKKVNELLSAQEFTSAAMKLQFTIECEKDLIESGDVAKQLYQLTQSNEFKKKDKERSLLREEESAQIKKYGESIGQPLSWWETETNKIRTTINAVPGSEQAYMLKRVLATLSVQCYMYTQQLLNAADRQKLNYIISLYKLVDPENKEPWFYSAVYNAKSGNNELAIQDLGVAINKGLIDKNRIMNEPAFQPLQSLSSYSALLIKLP